MPVPVTLVAVVSNRIFYFSAPFGTNDTGSKTLDFQFDTPREGTPSFFRIPELDPTTLQTFNISFGTVVPGTPGTTPTVVTVTADSSDGEGWTSPLNVDVIAIYPGGTFLPAATLSYAKAGTKKGTPKKTSTAKTKTKAKAKATTAAKKAPAPKTTAAAKKPAPKKTSTAAKPAAVKKPTPRKKK